MLSDKHLKIALNNRQKTRIFLSNGVSLYGRITDFDNKEIIMEYREPGLVQAINRNDIANMILPDKLSRDNIGNQI